MTKKAARDVYIALKDAVDDLEKQTIMVNRHIQLAEVDELKHSAKIVMGLANACRVYVLAQEVEIIENLLKGAKPNEDEKRDKAV